MSKNTKIILIVAAVAVVGYLGWKMWTNYKAQQGTNPNEALGTNLNSVAPELVGGSTGPEVGHAATIPINITLTEQVTNPDQDKRDEMKESSVVTPASLTRQSAAAGIMQGSQVSPSPTTPIPGDYEATAGGTGEVNG